MTPEITCNLSHEQRASDLVYFRATDTCNYQIFCCVSVRPTLTYLKFNRDQFCRGFGRAKQILLVQCVRNHILITLLLGELWWRSGESSRLPPLWSGFGFQTLQQILVEFVGFLLSSERFFPWCSSFPSPKKICI